MKWSDYCSHRPNAIILRPTIMQKYLDADIVRSLCKYLKTNEFQTIMEFGIQESIMLLVRILCSEEQISHLNLSSLVKKAACLGRRKCLRILLPLVNIGIRINGCLQLIAAGFSYKASVFF